MIIMTILASYVTLHVRLVLVLHYLLVSHVYQHSISISIPVFRLVLTRIISMGRYVLLAFSLAKNVLPLQSVHLVTRLYSFTTIIVWFHVLQE